MTLSDLLKRWDFLLLAFKYLFWNNVKTVKTSFSSLLYNQNHICLVLPVKDNELSGQKPLKIYWKTLLEIYLFDSKKNINYQVKFTLNLLILYLSSYHFFTLEMKYMIWGNVIRGTACWGNVHLGYCPFGQLSFRELPAGEMSSRNYPLGKNPLGKVL